MIARNLTPFLFGTKACSRRPPDPEMAIVVRGKLALVKGAPATPLTGLGEQGLMSGEQLGPDDEEGRGPVVYPGDFADEKIGAEVLLMGHCHAPGGTPVAECPVVFRVGAWRKALRVIGPRRYTDKLLGPGVTPPEPFTKMPLTWENAFGGEGDPRNPLGKGKKTPEVATVLLPDGVIESRRDTAAPASFGPIPSTWPERSARKGKNYGPVWKTTRAPFYASDFDPHHFHSAPADQWLPAPLKGDEEVYLQNLHPQEPLFSTFLPSLRIRAFVRRKDGDLREVAMALDTLLVEPDEGTLTLTWRGHTPVHEIDLTDVASMLLVSEPLAEPPKPAQEYTLLLEDFERDPVGLRRRLSPRMQELLDAHEREQRGEPPPPPLPGEDLDPVSALLRRKVGRFAPEEQAKLGGHPRRRRGSLEVGPGREIDLEAELAKLEAARRGQAAGRPSSPRPA
ncbi:MAG: DUF2169 domain-containing protein [Polyangiaceae bacterium]